ncbi:hypothetical protein Aperf_G00000097812 [Anoplocephala perfoliata]
MNAVADQTDQYVDEIFSICAYCGRTYERISLLLSHVNEVHESGSTATTDQNTPEHAISNGDPHSPETRKSFSTTDGPAAKGGTSCGDAVSNNGSAPRKPNRRRFPCNICGGTFTTLSYLKSHIATVHYKQKRHVCVHCGKAYTQGHSLKKHMMKKHPSQDKTENNQQGPAGQPGALDA